MTSLDPLLTKPAEVELAEELEATGLRGVEQILEGFSEKLNPILVKEARQALKSRQFLITFTLLLLAGWSWTMIGIAVAPDDIFFSAGGPFMLVGYFFILNVPLMLVVPFSAFRSLASEREHGTFELMSITALTSRQIVTGKLGSAVVQMLVYYSAIAPCIAFTYMLRGIDIVTIFLMLSFSFMASLLASAIALLMATLTRSQVWQIMMSVVVLIGLMFLLIMSFVVTVQFLFEAMLPLDLPMFWMAMLALLTGHLSYMALFVTAAAAQISFASDNRSTMLRVILLGQQVLFLGWMTYFWLATGQFDFMTVALLFSAIHWMVAGALMIGERAELSPRVKRRLPHSFLGRLTLTWFNPGAGTGYTFVVANLLAVCLAVAACGLIGDEWYNFGRGYDRPDWHYMAVYLWCYVAGYLGAARLVVLFVQRYFYFGLALPFLITVVLLVVGAVFPWLFQVAVQGFDAADEYTILQAPNWWFTLYMCLDSDGGDTLGSVWFLFVPLGACTVVVAGSVLIAVINSLLVVREVEQVRQATPQRVLQDDLESRPVKKLVPRTSPWDDDDRETAPPEEEPGAGPRPD